MDIDAVTGSMRVYHQLLQIIPPGWVEATAVSAGRWREAHSGDAHLIPLVKELRLLAPAGTIAMEANRDCEYLELNQKVGSSTWTCATVASKYILVCLPLFCHIDVILQFFKMINIQCSACPEN